MSEDHIRCCNCDKKISIGKAYPAYNHPEAPPVCFDCLPEEIKKELEEKGKDCLHKNTIAINEEGHAGIFCSGCGKQVEKEC